MIYDGIQMTDHLWREGGGLREGPPRFLMMDRFYKAIV